MPARVERLLGDLGHLEDGPAEDRLALMHDGGILRAGSSWPSDVAPVLALPDRSDWSPSEPQTVGPMPGVVGRADDDGAGAVAEDEGRAAVARGR